MEIKEAGIEGAYIITPQTYRDNRGFLREIFRKSRLEEKIGRSLDLEQINHSWSKKNVLRGIHVAPWSKLVYCYRGTAQSVIIDLRQDSKTFGKYISTIIGGENPVQIFISPGIGNSYLVLSEEADYIYLTDKEWEPRKEVGIIWNDPSLKIDWKIKGAPIVSEKDKTNPLLEAILRK